MELAVCIILAVELVTFLSYAISWVCMALPSRRSQPNWEEHDLYLLRRVLMMFFIMMITIIIAAFIL